VAIAAAVDRTANDAPQDEHWTATTYSLGCWVKEVPSFNRTTPPLRDARTYTNDPGDSVVPSRGGRVGGSPVG
jgi:hypothetical protein